VAHAHATANQRPPGRSSPYINTRHSQKRSELSLIIYAMLSDVNPHYLYLQKRSECL